MNSRNYIISDALIYLRNTDPVIDRISSLLPPLKREFREPNFEGMVRIIINQQLSGAAAGTIFDRLKSSMTDEAIKPIEAIEVEDNVYLKCGVSRAKTKHIKELANMFLHEPNIIRRFMELDPDSLQLEVQKLKGFGPWSSSIFSLFYMKNPDVFVYGDASVLRAIKTLYGEDTATDKELLRKLIKKWSPYNSVACMMMWHWVDNGSPI